MRIVALSVSKPKTIHHMGREVSTGIYKVPVQGPRMVRKTNMVLSSMDAPLNARAFDA